MLKSILRRLGLLTGSFLVSGLIGCGPDLITTELSPVSPRADPLTVSPTASAQLPTVGNAGTPFSDACPAGYVGTGLNVRTSNKLDQVQLICRKLNLDGTLGATALTPARGGTGGTAATGSCASNQIMSGQVLGIAGDPVSQVGALCSTATRLKNAAGGYDSTLSPLGPPGSPSTTACPAGYAITGLYGRTGVGAEQLGFKCKKLDDVKSSNWFGLSSGFAQVDSVSINGSILGQSANVAAGQNFQLSLHNSIENLQMGCSNCWTRYHIIVALISSDPSVAPQPLACTLSAYLNGGERADATSSLSLPAPTQPGTYTLRATVDPWSTSCNPQDGWAMGGAYGAIIGEMQVN
ncbi:hypothetical protein [Corallococcus sp. M7]